MIYVSACGQIWGSGPNWTWTIKGNTENTKIITNVISLYYIFCKTQVNKLQARGGAQKQNLPSCLKTAYMAELILVSLTRNK